MTIKDLERELNAKGGNLSGVYKITRKSDGKIYIGQSECITKRIIQHINNIRETNPDKIDGAIQSEGWENFDYSIELALPELNTEQLWLAESSTIAKYDSYNRGFNKTVGNHIGKYDHAEFTRKNVVSVALTKEIRDHFKLVLKNKKVLLINLFDEQFVNTLKFNDCEVSQISKYFEAKEDLGNYIMEELKNYMNVKFDLIIANPPYKKIGANITKTIVDNIEFEEYINLLPVNDYNRNDTKDLYKYVELGSIKPVINGFADAAVTTHMAKITKKEHRYISWDEFQIESYSDESLTKYFYETRNRSHYAIDNAGQLHMMSNPDANYTFFLAGRDINHKHLPWNNGKYTEDTLTYQWNINKISYDEAKKYSQKHAVEKGEVYFYGNTITFNTTTEKDNFTRFVYDNRLFINKVFTALQADGRIALSKVFPKVDWTRSWTVEEILKEYGYTQKEIEEVINDLVNYKGMED